MKILLINLLILITINIQSQNSELKEKFKVVTDYPVCLNCSDHIKNYIDQKINNLRINNPDTVVACFELDSLARISKIEIHKSSNTKLNNIISAAIQSSADWVPAFNIGKPTTVNICFGIIFKKNNGKYTSENFNLPSTDIDDFTSVRMERYYWKYFNSNSNERISHLDISKINGYTTLKADNYKNKGLHKSQHFKTKKLTINEPGEKISWILFVPKFKIYGTNKYGQGKALQIENVPVNHEIVLFIAKNEGNKVFISLEKFIYTGQKLYNPKFKEYTFSQLNSEIETYLKK
jgi:hypothetical protein